MRLLASTIAQAGQKADRIPIRSANPKNIRGGGSRCFSWSVSGAFIELIVRQFLDLLNKDRIRMTVSQGLPVDTYSLFRLPKQCVDVA